MTGEEAAATAADREARLIRSLNDYPCVPGIRDLYVRAFLAGAQWQQQQMQTIAKDFRRAWTAEKDTIPSTGSTASTDNAESEPRGKS